MAKPDVMRVHANATNPQVYRFKLPTAAQASTQASTGQDGA